MITAIFAVDCNDRDAVDLPDGAQTIRASLAAVNEVCTTQRSPNVVLPADDAPHPLQSTEEWYYNMHLATKGGAQYGVRLAFFQNATQLAPFTESLATLDVTDLAGAHPTFVSDTISLLGSTFPPSQAAFSLEVSDNAHRDSAEGDDGSDHVTGQLAGYAFGSSRRKNLRCCTVIVGSCRCRLAMTTITRAPAWMSKARSGSRQARSRSRASLGSIISMESAQQ